MKSKIIISVITTAMVFLGGYVFAFESGDAANYQAQVQDLSGVDYGITGADSKYGGAQVDVGASSTNGGNGMEYNHQGQGAHVNAINSTGTARHQYDVDMETRGASTSTGWGSAAHIEINGTRAAISTRSDGTGTGMASGASIEAASGSAAGATWSGAAVGISGVNAKTEYEQVNYGAQSAQYSTGVSNVKTGTIAYSVIGGQRAGARAATVGDTRMVNDGVGGAMSSGGKSHSEVDTGTFGVGSGFAGASASASNTHKASQTAVGAGTYQYQNTIVHTSAAE